MEGGGGLYISAKQYRDRLEKMNDEEFLNEYEFQRGIDKEDVREDLENERDSMTDELVAHIVKSSIGRIKEAGGDLQIHNTKHGLKACRIIKKSDYPALKEFAEEILDKTKNNGEGLNSELAIGEEVELEHKGTLAKLHSGEITLEEAPTEIAKDHLKEDPKYYTKLLKMESEFKTGENFTKA
jgi:hypothetical protein